MTNAEKFKEIFGFALRKTDWEAVTPFCGDKCPYYKECTEDDLCYADRWLDDEYRKLEGLE